MDSNKILIGCLVAAAGVLVYWLYSRRRQHFIAPDPTSICAAFLMGNMGNKITDSQRMAMYNACEIGVDRCGKASVWHQITNIWSSLDFKKDPYGSVQQAIQIFTTECEAPKTCNRGECPQYYDLKCIDGMCQETS